MGVFLGTFLGEKIDFQFKFPMNIGPGNYSVAFSLSGADSHLEKNYEWRDYGAIFQVVNNDKESFIGSAWLNATSIVMRHTDS